MINLTNKQAILLEQLFGKFGKDEFEIKEANNFIGDNSIIKDCLHRPYETFDRLVKKGAIVEVPREGKIEEDPNKKNYKIVSNYSSGSDRITESSTLESFCQ